MGDENVVVFMAMDILVDMLGGYGTRLANASF
jgi:hypothetical protein